MHDLITILGPTATGKTSLAAGLAAKIDGEIISADSRQVYRGMDLGTGKDLEDYIVNGFQIPYHLIDIADPGEEYNVYRFQKDFLSAFNDIRKREKKAIMCGGTGMYLESVLLSYDMLEVVPNQALKEELQALATDELILRLKGLKSLHNVTDTSDRDRLIRAIEISETRALIPEVRNPFPQIKHRVFGISLPREEIRERITLRLKQRIEAGMPAEVEKLLDSGLKPDQLEFYGLEYKFLTRYVTGKINEESMFSLLNTAIHQFAKRQMTWFRRMEKKGVKIEWVDGKLPLADKLQNLLDKISS